MECMQCGAQWTVREGQTRLANCPFCGKPLLMERSTAIYTDFMEAMRAVVQMKGAGFLLNEPSKVLGIFLDITKGLQREYQLLKLFYGNETQKFFKDMQGLPEGQLVRAARSLQENMFMDANSAKYIVDTFAVLLGKKEAPARPIGGEMRPNRQSLAQESREVKQNQAVFEPVKREDAQPPLQKGRVFAERLEKGALIELDNMKYQVAEFQLVRPPRGAAFVRVKLQNVNSGGVMEQVFRPQEQLVIWNEEAVAARAKAEAAKAKAEREAVSKREMQYLYFDDADGCYHFMDPENYEFIALSSETVGQAAKFMNMNDMYKICFRGGNAFAVEPSSGY